MYSVAFHYRLLFYIFWAITKLITLPSTFSNRKLYLQHHPLAKKNRVNGPSKNKVNHPIPTVNAKITVVQFSDFPACIFSHIRFLIPKNLQNQILRETVTDYVPISQYLKWILGLSILESNIRIYNCTWLRNSTRFLYTVCIPTTE